MKSNNQFPHQTTVISYHPIKYKSNYKAVKLLIRKELFLKNFLYAKQSHFAVRLLRAEDYRDFLWTEQTSGTNFCSKIVMDYFFLLLNNDSAISPAVTRPSIIADENPSCSILLRPAMVQPSGVVTRSISDSG